MRRVEDMSRRHLITLFWTTWLALVKMEGRAEVAERRLAEHFEMPLPAFVKLHAQRERRAHIQTGKQIGAVVRRLRDGTVLRAKGGDLIRVSQDKTGDFQ